MQIFRYGRVLCIAAGLGVAACGANPDMTEFSAQTAALQVTVAAEQQEIIKEYDRIIRLTGQAAREEWLEGTSLPASSQAESGAAAKLPKTYDPADWRKERGEVLAFTRQVDGLMADITAYSTSLVNLAAKGETGKKAVEDSLGSLQNIANLVNVAGASVPAAAVTLLKEIGDLVTRAQARKSLDKAMSEIARNKGAQKVADVLKAYFEEDLAPLADSLRTNRVQLERYKTGPNMIRFYNAYASWQSRDRSFALLLLDDAARQEKLGNRPEAQLYADLLKCYDAGARGCPRASAVSGLASALILLDAISDDARAYYETKRKVEAWSKQRRDRVAAIGTALDAWATEHDRLANWFAKCAGAGGLKKSCGAWSAANLQAAVERIKSVQSSLENAPAEEGG